MEYEHAPLLSEGGETPTATATAASAGAPTVPDKERRALEYYTGHEKTLHWAFLGCVLFNFLDFLANIVIAVLALAVILMRSDADPQYTCDSDAVYPYLIVTVIIYIIMGLINLWQTIFVFTERGKLLAEVRRGVAPRGKCKLFGFIIGALNPTNLILTIIATVFLGKGCYGEDGEKSLTVMKLTVIGMWGEFIFSQIITMTVLIYRMPVLMLYAPSVRLDMPLNDLYHAVQNKLDQKFGAH
ncbi:hypothetical protein Pelo_4403 [Pelomyxa schiedti]|nr:hypothetical protein Pelo_4403 [Pelomyxa schiedti]